MEFLQKVEGKPLKGPEDVLLLHKGHFAVDLGKFGLAVRPEVLVPETLDDLEVFVHAADHQQLLEGLGGLGKGVKLPFVHTAGHHEIPGSLGGGFDQVGGFHFDKAFFGQVVPNGHRNPGAKDEVVFYRTAPDVQIAVFHPELLAPVRGVLNGKGRGQGGVEHGHFGDQDFDVPRRDFRVFGGPFDDLSAHLQHKLPPGLPGLFQEFRGRTVLVENELGNAVSVAKVNPDDETFVADGLHPPGQLYVLADMGFIQFTTGMSTVHSPEYFSGKGTMQRGKCPTFVGFFPFEI